MNYSRQTTNKKGYFSYLGPASSGGGSYFFDAGLFEFEGETEKGDAILLRREGKKLI
ncbi:MAG: hypothetical protein ACYC6P_13145 [Ignavibacteriaceae bacterium]